MSQRPQCALLVARSTQLPLHSEELGGQTQTPSSQTRPSPQVLPQRMQLPESLIRSTQTPLHSVRSAGQTQLPFEQTVPPAQGRLHPPQWSGSLSVSTHCDSQIV